MGDEHAYPEPPAVGGEADTLLGSLERQRATLSWKCADLDGAGLSAALPPSTVTLGGLLKHLAYMEDINFTRDLAGLDLPAPWAQARSGVRDWEWSSAGDDSPSELRRLWSEAVERSRSAVAETLTAGGVDSQFTTAGGRPCTLRRLLVDMIEEYARHTGQADLIRESVDGRVGEDPPGRPYPYSVPRPDPGSPWPQEVVDR